jgi:hypothetical protein
MVPTAGSEPYPEGASKALLALARKVMDPAAPKQRNGINVLGAIHLSTGKEEHLAPLLAAIEQAGFPLVGVFSAPRADAADPLEGVRNAPGAALNAVVSTSGLGLAEYMHATYGIPYVVGMPVGRSGRADFLALLRGQTPGPAPACARPAPCARALVVGAGPELRRAALPLPRFRRAPGGRGLGGPGRGALQDVPGCAGTLVEPAPATGRPNPSRRSPRS